MMSNIYIRNLYKVTLGNMLAFSGVNTIYYGYDNFVNQRTIYVERTDIGKYDIDRQVGDIIIGGYYGLTRGCVLGLVWPVTYIVYANHLYNKYCKINVNNDSILP